MDRKSRCFKNGAQKSNGRAFAICPCNVKDRRQAPMWRTQSFKQRGDAPERKVDQFRMER
jgi:hypothetical protein